jgi:hypothetical protein
MFTALIARRCVILRTTMRHTPSSQHELAPSVSLFRRGGFSLTTLALRLMVALTIAACSQHDVAVNAATENDPQAPQASSAQTASPATLCAAERGFCRFSGTEQVRYGTSNRYVVLTLTGGKPCNNSVFGDPAPGSQKNCWIVHTSATNAAAPPDPDATLVADGTDARSQDPPPAATAAPHRAAITWTACASERGTCAFSGTHDVKYGSDSKYVILTFTGGTACDNTVFGDPAPGAQKRCWYDSGVAPAPTPTSIIATPGKSALTCGAPSEPANAAADGPAIEADTPGGDGTRMFVNGHPFAVELTTRARQRDTLDWQILDTWSNVRDLGNSRSRAARRSSRSIAYRRSPVTLPSPRA